MKPSGVRAYRASGSAASSSPHPLDAAGGGRFEDAELGLGSEQRVGGLALLVEERQQDHGQPVAVARGRELGTLGHERPDRLHVAGRDRADQCVAHSRRMPQTSSATSFVNAASWKKLGGLPREVSENATVPSSIRTR